MGTAGMAQRTPITFDTCWLTIFSELNRRMSKRLEAEHSLTMTQYRILLELAAAGGNLPGSAFPNLLILKPSGITCAFNKLSDRHLILRTRPADDRRAITVELEEDGRSTLREASASIESTLAQAWSGLTDGQIDLVLESTKYPFEKLSGHTAVKSDSPVQAFYMTTLVILHQLWSTCLKQEFGLSLTKFRILLLLSETESGCRVGDISQRLALELSAVSGAVGILANAGMVELVQESHDRRGYRAVLNPSEQKDGGTFAKAHARLALMNDAFYADTPDHMIAPLAEVAQHIYAILTSSR